MENRVFQVILVKKELKVLWVTRVNLDLAVSLDFKVFRAILVFKVLEDTLDSKALKVLLDLVLKELLVPKDSLVIKDSQVEDSEDFKVTLATKVFRDFKDIKVKKVHLVVLHLNIK